MIPNRQETLKRTAKVLILRGLLLLGLLLAPLVPAFAADPNPGNDSDAITLAILPLADLGVDIDTDSVNLDLTMAPGATSYVLAPATITLLGNIQPQEYDLQGQALDTWTLDSDETAGADEVQVYALFGSGRQAPPSESEFAGVKNLITTSVKRAGATPGVGANGNFENDAMTGAAEMDNILLISPARQLWLRVDAPPLTTSDEVQRVTITVTATRTGL